MTGNTDNDGGENDDEDNTTTTAATRWNYTNDVLAALLIGSLCVLTIASTFTGVTIPDSTTWTISVSLAAVWAFGVKAVEALRSLIAGSGSP